MRYVAIIAFNILFTFSHATKTDKIYRNKILTDSGFEAGINGEMQSDNSEWEVQRTGEDITNFIVHRVENKNKAYKGKKYCFLSLPLSANALNFEHITIGQRRKLKANSIYEVSIWVKWENVKNGNSSAIVSFWAQHTTKKTFAGKDYWLKNNEWTRLSFRFIAIEPYEPVFIYISLLPHQTPQTTDLLVDDFSCKLVENLRNIATGNEKVVLNEDFENKNENSLISKPWILTKPEKINTGIVVCENGNKFVRIKIPENTDNFTAINLMQKIVLKKGHGYDINVSFRWNNYSEQSKQRIVNWGIYHKESNTWWGPIDHIVSMGEWHNAPFEYGAPYSGEFHLYVQVFGWGNFGNPLDISIDNFLVTEKTIFHNNTNNY